MNPSVQAAYDQLYRMEDLCDDLDMVRASDIARRCGVTRSTVSQWNSFEWHGTRLVNVGGMPIAHLVVADVEFWSWPLLCLYDPDRFPSHRPETNDRPMPTADVDQPAGS